MFTHLYEIKTSLSLLSSYTFLLYGSMKRSQTQVFHRKKPLDKFSFFFGNWKRLIQGREASFSCRCISQLTDAQVGVFPFSSSPPRRISLSLSFLRVSLFLFLSPFQVPTLTHTSEPFFKKTRCV